MLPLQIIINNNNNVTNSCVAYFNFSMQNYIKTGIVWVATFNILRKGSVSRENLLKSRGMHAFATVGY